MVAQVISNVEHAGVGGCEVVIEEGRVSDILRAVVPGPKRQKLDGAGGAVVPGLWDHHAHVLATAALDWSVNVAQIREINEFIGTLRQAIRRSTEPEIRVVGYDELELGELTGPRLDRMIETSVPIRVQHRSGHQWVYNNAAQRALGQSVQTPEDGVVWREPTSRPNAKFTRQVRHAVHGVIQKLIASGCVGVSDMSATATAEDIRALRALLEPTLFLEAYGEPNNGSGFIKHIASDHEYQDPDEVASWMENVDDKVAIHTVSAETLALITSAGEDLGPHVRLEHVFMASDDLLTSLAGRGVELGVHPGFIRTHGNRVLANYPIDEAAQYQRLGAMRDAGFSMFGGTDRPYATESLWECMQAAVDRRTRTGQVISADQALTPEQAFALFTRGGLQHDAEAPRLAVGQPADLCVIDRIWGSARDDLAQVSVVLTLAGGLMTWWRNHS